MKSALPEEQSEYVQFIEIEHDILIVRASGEFRDDIWSEKFGLTQSIVSLCELEGNKIRGITIDLSQCRWIDPLPLLSVLLFLAQ